MREGWRKNWGLQNRGRGGSGMDVLTGTARKEKKLAWERKGRLRD